MNIRILQLIDGAKQARGLTVIIDVLRAFSVEAYIMHGGAEKICPVADISIALDEKQKNNDVIIIGERHGEKIEGFDYGNSPSQIEGVNFKGKTVIHTTSAGTQGIANASGASEILTGSLVNAKAIAKYIKRINPSEVSLVCMGLAGKTPTKEDTLCAEYIKSLLEGTDIDLVGGIESIKATDGAKFFDKSRQNVFPEKDFYLCTDCDKFDFVLKLVKVPDGLDYITKIDVK